MSEERPEFFLRLVQDLVLLVKPQPPRSTLFPYTTLFRSIVAVPAKVRKRCGVAGPQARSSPARARAIRCRAVGPRSEEHTSELQSRRDLVCRLLLEKKKKLPRHRTDPPRLSLEHRLDHTI